MTKADKEGQRKAPILRFKSFTDDWEQRKLLKVCKKEDNKRIPIKEQERKEGNTPYFGANGIQGYIDGYTHDGTNILIAEDGANNVRNYPIKLITGKIWVNNHAHVLKVNTKTNNGNFLVGAIKKINFYRYLVGSSRYKLTAESLNQVKIKIAKQSEQEKIGKLLKNIEKLLTLYERKLKLVKLIYKELENKVYNNDLIKQTNFTKVKLGEILKEKNIKSTYEDQYPVLSSTNSGIELRNGRTNSSSNIGYKVLSKNELVLSPQNLWLGNININFNFGNSLVSPSYKVFSLTNNVNIIYLNSLLHHPKMMYLYKVVSVQGASVVRRNLDIEAFKNLTLKLPSIEAQDKIGNLLDKNKQLIDNLENKKEQFSKVKTTLLNTMFI